MIRISWAGIRTAVSTGYHVDRSKWNGSRCRPNTFHGDSHTPAATVNRVIANLERDIDNAFLAFETADTIPSRDQLKTALSPKKTQDETVWNAFTEFMRHGETARQWSDNTAKSVHCVRNLVREFRPDLTFKDIDAALMTDFASWQQTHRLSKNKFKTGHKGYANNVIRKNCTVFRWFVKWAAGRNLVPHEAAASLSTHVKSIPRPVIFLSWEELTRLERHPYEPGSEMDRARDFFVFCCFSSLRFSDAHALMKTSVRTDSFSITTVKTATPITIDLNDHSRRILEKYRHTDSPYALPRVTNNRLNHLVKEMGKDIHLDDPVTVSQYYGAERIDRKVPRHELLSTHAGRRTFIVNALSLGIAPNIVMKWTGHSDYTAMKPYIDIADSIRRNVMSLFNK